MSVLLELAAQSISIRTQRFSFPDITINKGELVGLIGQSGSGKSILLRQLAGLMETSEPLVFLGDRRSFIFSRGGLFQHQTVRENLSIPTLFTKLSISKYDIDDVLTQWNLQNIQNHFPPQLNPQATKVVQIARSILLQPDIVFIEKPLVGLSVQQADRLIRWVETHTKAGGSVVYSDENQRTFRTLNPKLIDLGGGHDNLRTVMHR